MTQTPRLPTESERRSLWWFALIFLVVSIVGALVTEFEGYRWKLNNGYYRAEPSLPPEDGFGRYELGNYKLQIPVKYLYDFYEDRGNRWLEDRRPQKVGGGVIFDVFLPDFKPYGPQVHGNEKRIREDRLYVSLADEAKNPVGYPQDVLIERLALSYQEVPSDLPGFRELGGRGHNKQRYYFESPLSDNYFRMICNGTLCMTWVVYPEYPGLVVHYTFVEKKYFGQRSQIHEAIKPLIKKFIVSQFTN
jgi:hypothetical protein